MKFCRNKLVPLFITGKEVLDTQDVIRLLQESETFATKYEKNEDYFYGKHEILNRTFDDTSKPNNHVMCNIPKYIVQVRTGFFSRLLSRTYIQSLGFCAVIASLPSSFM